MRNFFDNVGEAFRNYFSFRGVANRPQFWHWQLFVVLAGIIVVTLFTVEALWVWGAITIIPSITIAVRRLRDAGIPVWLTLFILFPFGQLAIFAMALAPTKR
ncbi:MAG TPA: DUF805 domain-containing protein [Microbacteriaceae bacterium]